MFTCKWLKLHSEEPDNLYSSPNIKKMIKSRNIRLVVMQQESENENFLQNFGWKVRRKELMCKT